MSDAVRDHWVARRSHLKKVRYSAAADERRHLPPADAARPTDVSVGGVINHKCLVRRGTFTH